VQLRSATNEVLDNSQGAAVEIVGPDGRRPLILQEEATAQSFRLTHAGFYQIRFASGQEALIAVNPDRRESALDLIPDDVLRSWSGSAAATQTSVVSTAEARKTPYNLWWWFMLLLLIAAIAESGVASRYLSTQREEV